MGKVSVRTTKTASGSTAVQVVRYEARRVKVLRHVGSARTEEEVQALKESAQAMVCDLTAQLSLFEMAPRTLALEYATYVGSLNLLAYRVLSALLQRFGFVAAAGALATDLAIMRLVEPASKRRSLTLLTRYFGIEHAERRLYRTLKTLNARKQVVEGCALRLAQTTNELSFVLYDVTTLYFETHAEDEALRSRGFSKDNKVNQPQIVIGLLVDLSGAPVGYDVFPGKTFEGHTMLPLLDTFATQHGIPVKTIVADAAMLSRENIKQLEANGYQYIVGARLANLPERLRAALADVPREHGAIQRFATDRGDLIVSFSSSRFAKDKGDMERQWKRATTLVDRAEAGRRAKFVKKQGGTFVLDEELKQKTEALLGLKGYHTSIPEAVLSSAQIIERYDDLWRIEQAFRVTKSDLAARPIFHRLEDSIRAHLLICFMALAVAKYIERMTGRSIRAVRDELMHITEARIIDRSTGKTISLPMPLSESVREIVRMLGVSY